MSQGRAFRVRDVAAYLRVSRQRGTQMYADGKLPEPDQVDGIGPLWTPAKIERWAEREWGGRRGVGGRGAGVDEYETHERYLRGAADHWRDAVRLQQERLKSDTLESRFERDRVS